MNLYSESNLNFNSRQCWTLSDSTTSELDQIWESVPFSVEIRFFCSWLDVCFSFSGCGRWVRILCQATVGDTLLCAQLLRRIRQRRCHDVSRRNTHVLLSNSQSKSHWLDNNTKKREQKYVHRWRHSSYIKIQWSKTPLRFRWLSYSLSLGIFRSQM